MRKFVYILVVVVSFGSYMIYQNQLPASSTSGMVGSVGSTSSKSIADTTNGSDQTSSSNSATTPTSTSSSTPPPQPKGVYADGTYTGPSTYAYYGYVQVKATISGGKLTDVSFIDYPHDRGTSRYINSIATPRLAQEAITAQTANVNIVSGATDTSMAFRQSLSSALSSAKS